MKRGKRIRQRAFLLPGGRICRKTDHAVRDKRKAFGGRTDEGQKRAAYMAAEHHHCPKGQKKKGGPLWHSSTAQSPYYRHSLSPLAQALESGAPSTFSKGMAMTIRARMLMYGKEASNRKQ
jgi:hypothetical protein